MTRNTEGYDYVKLDRLLASKVASPIWLLRLVQSNHMVRTMVTANHVGYRCNYCILDQLVMLAERGVGDVA